MTITIGCLKDIVATNTGNKLFIKGIVYKCEMMNERYVLKDEFGAIRVIHPNEAFFGKHFQVINKGESE